MSRALAIRIAKLEQLLNPAPCGCGRRVVNLTGERYVSPNDASISPSSAGFRCRACEARIARGEAVIRTVNLTGVKIGGGTHCC